MSALTDQDAGAVAEAYLHDFAYPSEQPMGVNSIQVRLLRLTSCRVPSHVVMTVCAAHGYHVDLAEQTVGVAFRSRPRSAEH